MDRPQRPMSVKNTGVMSSVPTPRPASTSALAVPVSKDSFKETAAVVIDTGTGFTKAGFSGDEKPRATIKTVVWVPKLSRGHWQQQEVPYYLGDNIPKDRAEKKHLMTHGVVTDWDALEMLWHHVIYSELRVSPEEHAVLVTDSPNSPMTNREKSAELLFENFGVPAMYIAHQSLLSVYSYGRVSGIVIDSGSGTSYVSPVHNGYGLPHATYWMDLAGKALTNYMGKLMGECGNSFGSHEKHLVREIKEKCCYVSEDFEAELSGDERHYLIDYTLPDGQIISIGNERFRCPEALFNPSALGISEPGLHIKVINSIQKCSAHQHKDLMENILICGGTTLFRGFPDRMKKELAKLVPTEARVNVMASPHRQFAAWLGGSILPCLNSFQPFWIHRKDYDEKGAFIVHRKCF